MKNIVNFMFSLLLVGSMGCSNQQAIDGHVEKSVIGNDVIGATIKALTEKYPEVDGQRIERGVKQTAALWFADNGNAEALLTFAMKIS